MSNGHPAMQDSPTLRATIEVFTFKEGVFAKLAHDLHLSLLDFDITLEGRQLTARFGLASLRVDGVAHGERIDTRALSDGDLRRIRDTMQHEILEVEKFPDVIFTGVVSDTSDKRLDVAGKLALHGHQREQHVIGLRTRESLRAEVTLTPSSFGIAPFKALGGAIRLQDRVLLRGTLALPEGDLSGLFAPGSITSWSPRNSGTFSPSGT